MTIKDINSSYIQYCTTDKQKKIVQYFIDHKGVCDIKTAIRDLNVSRSTFFKTITMVRKNAEVHGLAPEHDMKKTVPDDYIVDGVSTLYDKDGEVITQWVKSKLNKSKYIEFVKTVVKDIASDVKRVKRRNLNHSVEDKLIVYPLADLHIGMLSWSKETGEDYNLEIAENTLKSVIQKAIDRSPSCDECLICNLGDFFHVDNLRNETERSHNSLDVDSRYSKIFRIGIRMIRFCIELALEKHNKVYVVNSAGNHDDMGSLVLSVALDNIYEKEPRVKIFDAPKPRHYFRFGNTLIGMTHGHNNKMNELPLIMATEQSKDWGETQYHYWYTGHIHHDREIEVGACKVESFRTIAAKDAWTNAKGFLSGRDLKCIVIDKNDGEIERYTFKI